MFLGRLGRISSSRATKASWMIPGPWGWGPESQRMHDIAGCVGHLSRRPSALTTPDAPSANGLETEARLQGFLPSLGRGDRGAGR